MDQNATIFLDAGKLQISAVCSTQQTSESMSWDVFKDKKPINKRKCGVQGWAMK